MAANALAASWDPMRGRPATEEEAQRISALKEHFAELRAHLVGVTPPSREQRLAVTHLEDACMRATRAVLQPWPAGPMQGVDCVCEDGTPHAHGIPGTTRRSTPTLDVGPG